MKKSLCLIAFVCVAAFASAQTFYPFQIGGYGIPTATSQCANPATNLFSICPLASGPYFTANGSAYASLVGPAGPTGATGAQGAQGPQGPAGPGGRHQILFIFDNGNLFTMTSSLTDMLGSYFVTEGDLTPFTSFRLVKNSLGIPAGATLRAYYKQNCNSGETMTSPGWSQLENTTNTGDLAGNSTSGIQVGAWSPIAAGAVGDGMCLSVGVFGGNGSGINFYRLFLELK